MALDLGAVVGVTLLYRGRPPITEAWFLNGDHRGARFNTLYERLIEFCTRHRLENGPIEIGGFEAALMEGARGPDAVRAALGYSAIVEAAFTKLQIRYYSEHLNTMRAHVTGRGTYPKGTAKEEVMKHVREKMGIEVFDDNIADSIVVAEWFANCCGWSVLDGVD